LGYHFGPEGLTVAAKTIEQFVERALRLYEQEPGAASSHSRFGMYERRWAGWAEAGVLRGTDVSFPISSYVIIAVQKLGAPDN
jgi:hypothetical protein